MTIVCGNCGKEGWDISLERGPSGRWFWRVGEYQGEEDTRDEAYDRARDIQRRLGPLPKKGETKPSEERRP